jgi:hypothetical protein
VVIEKRAVAAPFDLKQGEYTVGYMEDAPETIGYKIKFFLFQVKNRIRSAFYK